MLAVYMVLFLERALWRASITEGLARVSGKSCRILRQARCKERYSNESVKEQGRL